MNTKYIFPSVTAIFVACVVTITACKKESGPPPPPRTHSFVEEFDTVQNAVDRGWKIINNSRDIGSASWVQGDYGIDFLKGVVVGFPPQSYKYSGQDFAVCTYNAADGNSTISAWLISPPTVMKTGDQIVFYTRTTQSPAVNPDRLQVRLNTVDSSTNVGSGPLTNMEVANMVGSFSELLFDINPNLVKSGTGAYPAQWTKYTLMVRNIPEPASRRFAFRYFVTNGGTTGPNSEAIGIDSVAFVSK